MESVQVNSSSNTFCSTSKLETLNLSDMTFVHEHDRVMQDICSDCENPKNELSVWQTFVELTPPNFNTNLPS